MTKLKRFCSVFVVLLSLGAGYGHAQQSDWQAFSETVRNSDEGFPEFIRFASDAPFGLSDFPALLSQVLELGQDDDFRLVKTDSDYLGYRHYHYQQYHRGIPVRFAIYKAHVLGSKLVSMNGNFFPVQQQGAASLSEETALQAAIDATGADVYKWELPVEEAWLKLITGDPFAGFTPHGELVYIFNQGKQNPESMRLAWEFDIYAHEPMSRADVYVDAQTGEIVFRNEMIHTADANGIAETLYSGTQNIVTDSTASGFRLRESGRAQGVETYNMQTGQNYGNAVDFTDSDNFWDNVNPQEDEVATDAHWGAEMTFDYFFQNFNWNSYDNQGSKLISYVHYGQSYVNAFWNGSVMTYGDGGSGYNPFPALDVCGHEFSHGLTGNSAALVYQNEPGALNESFSDIFGTAIEFFARPSNANFRIGEDLTGGGLRNMANPNQHNNPDTYFGTNWYTGTGDNGGVHTNSGVQNFWFYLLTGGGAGVNDHGDPYSVTGIGISSAAAISFRNLTVYLGANSEYDDARFYSIQSAIDLYGACSTEMIQTANAWYAVGVGNAWTGNLDADFTTNDTLGCLTPYPVQFTNNSNSAIGYTWDFGDGGTSNAVNPVHSYNATGTYTVTLISEGCNNTFDTLVMTNRIVVDGNQVCAVNVPVNGNITLTNCNGELYDSGGADNYIDNTNSTVTITPGGNNNVVLTFTSFNYAAGDRIEVFDGPNTSSPSLGIFVGTAIPGPFTSTSGSLTVQESTNGFNNRDGFTANWSCVAVSNDLALQSGEMKVYPNPVNNGSANNHFRVEFASTASGNISLSLVDMFGKVLEKRDFANTAFVQEDFSVTGLSAGIYLLRLQDDHGQQVKRIRVQ